jgi:DNA end-binding protein Ku
VEAHEKGRGYKYAKGSHLMIEDQELEAIEIESNHTIEIDSFVPHAEIDERFLDSPYYIAPNEPVGRRLSRSSGRRCAVRTWSHLAASCCRSASE